MSGRREQQAEKRDEELPAYFAALGTGSPKPRQKYGGMFCNVEGAFENKTLDFESLRGGKRESQPSSRSDLSQRSSDSEGQSEASSGSHSAPLLTPAGPVACPPSDGVVEEMPNGCHQVTGKEDTGDGH